jgi:2-polyprenyl-3-methyl-5-hydroxy-6-metoxy-1,4-benzoquinol methylase
MIDEFESIAYVHASSRSTAEVLEELRPAIYFKGADWKGRIPPAEAEICKRHGVEIAFLDTVTDSSSKRLRDLVGAPIPEQVAGFEKFVQEQKATAAATYDAAYFHDKWRDPSYGDYTVEARRKIEGRNPELIRDTFQPKRVLDMGCGPGALMYLLHELGVIADGVDFAEASKSLAPAEVRDRITIGSVTDVGLPDDAYDLLICREVLEHLTVIEVQRAIANMCRISSRYIYMTTRYHPAPATLFDVTTEFHVDPTHITLMHMEMVRVMFILQGFVRRRDLEAKMDWLNKGRVMVYEKAR